MPMTSLQFQPLPNAAAPRSAKIPAGNPARSSLSTSLTLARGTIVAHPAVNKIVKLIKVRLRANE
jgi:hypothetical protein